MPRDTNHSKNGGNLPLKIGRLAVFRKPHTDCSNECTLAVLVDLDQQENSVPYKSKCIQAKLIFKEMWALKHSTICRHTYSWLIARNYIILIIPVNWELTNIITTVSGGIIKNLNRSMTGIMTGSYGSVSNEGLINQRA